MPSIVVSFIFLITFSDFSAIALSMDVNIVLKYSCNELSNIWRQSVHIKLKAEKNYYYYCHIIMQLSAISYVFHNY